MFETLSRQHLNSPHVNNKSLNITETPFPQPDTQLLTNSFLLLRSRRVSCIDNRVIHSCCLHTIKDKKLKRNKVIKRLLS